MEGAEDSPQPGVIKPGKSTQSLVGPSLPSLLHPKDQSDRDCLAGALQPAGQGPASNATVGSVALPPPPPLPTPVPTQPAERYTSANFERQLFLALHVSPVQTCATFEAHFEVCAVLHQERSSG